MYTKKTTEVEVTKIEEQVIDEYKTCNKCGKKVHPIYEECFSDIENIHISFGYSGNFDTENWNFDLCDDCLVEFIKTFKYVPEGFMIHIYNCDLPQDKHQKIFDNWKETDKWEEYKFDTYDEIVSRKGYMRKDLINNLIKLYHPNKPLID